MSIEFSPSGELAALTTPMDKKFLMHFKDICLKQLKMSPEEAVRKMVYQVVLQEAQKRGKSA